MRNFYSVTALLGCIILGLLLLRMREIGEEGQTQKRYKLLVVSSIVLSMTDMLWGMFHLSYRPLDRLLFVFVAYLYFFMISFVNFTWIRFNVAQMRFRPTAIKIRNIARVNIAIQMVILVTNPIHHLLFTVRDSGTYIVSYLRTVVFSLQAFNALLILIASIYYYATSPKNSIQNKNALYGMIGAVLPMLTVYFAWRRTDSPMYSWGYLGICVYIYVLDITQLLVVRTEELKQQKAEIQEDRNAIVEVYETSRKSNSYKNEFLAKMSHEMIMPVNSIMALCSVAAAEADDAEKVTECLQKIRLSAERVMKDINDVMYMSDVKMERNSLDLEEVDLMEVLGDIEKGANSLASELGNVLKFRINNVTHPYVLADREKCRMCCLALLSNALKYTPTGGLVTMYVNELPSSRSNFAKFQFIFEDNGIGMDEECKSRMFEPFYRGNDPRVQAVKGSGLGLPIVTNVVNMANGKIDVESEPEKGTKITITVNFELNEAVQELDDDSANRMTLLVDNDSASCASLAFVLEEIGIKCKYFYTSRAAISHLKRIQNPKATYNVIILDWYTISSNTEVLINSFREELGEDIPILLTVPNDSTIDDDSKPEGIDGVIHKPCFKTKMEEAYKKIIE